MKRYHVSKETAAIIPDLIKKHNITSPIYRVEETKTLIRFYLYGRTKPFTVKKPGRTRSRPRSAKKED